MCVIVACINNFPSFEDLKKMEKTNRDGAGIAWEADNMLYYEKGLTAKDIQDFIVNVNILPCVIHFRLGTVGKTTPYLCHPFEVDYHSKLRLQGKTTKPLLFHNGHIELALHRNILPSHFRTGKYSSDTRELAKAVSVYGQNILHSFPYNEFCLYKLNDIVLFGDWKEEEGIYYSNLYWKNRTRYSEQWYWDDDYYNFDNYPYYDSKYIHNKRWGV